jgi:hypothetical protein
MKCYFCVQAENKKLLTFSKHKNLAFIHGGFCNWKKATQMFAEHESCGQHKEATMKLSMQGKISVVEQLNAEHRIQQKDARTALLAIFSSLHFLARQGLAVRGHLHEDGNFMQLLKMHTMYIPSLEQWIEKRTIGHQIHVRMRF